MKMLCWIVLAAAIATCSGAAAAPSPLLEYVVTDQATMFDIGMIRMQDFFTKNLDPNLYRVAFPDLITVAPQVQFDLDRNRFDVDIRAFFKEDTEQVFMKLMIQVMFASMVPNDEINLHYFFEHQGWSTAASRAAAMRFDFSEIDKSTYVHITATTTGNKPPVKVVGHWNFAEHQLMFE